MIAFSSITLGTTAHFASKESAPDSVKLDSAVVEGKWYGEGSLGVPFTEVLTQTEKNLLTELLTTVAARVAEQKARENDAAALV